MRLHDTRHTWQRESEARRGQASRAPPTRQNGCMRVGTGSRTLQVHMLHYAHERCQGCQPWLSLLAAAAACSKCRFGLAYPSKNVNSGLPSDIFSDVSNALMSFQKRRVSTSCRRAQHGKQQRRRIRQPIGGRVGSGERTAEIDVTNHRRSECRKPHARTGQQIGTPTDDRTIRGCEAKERRVTVVRVAANRSVCKAHPLCEERSTTTTTTTTAAGGASLGLGFLILCTHSMAEQDTVLSKRSYLKNPRKKYGR